MADFDDETWDQGPKKDLVCIGFEDGCRCLAVGVGVGVWVVNRGSKSIHTTQLPNFNLMRGALLKLIHEVDRDNLETFAADVFEGQLLSLPL